MLRTFGFLPLTALSIAILMGCGPSTSQRPAGKQTANPQTPAANPEPSTAEQEVAAKDVPPGLAELSKEDRDAALAQKTCPVSGEPLGSMGKPVKITVKGQTVFLCCNGCVDAIKKDPDKYLAKLKGKK